MTENNGPKEPFIAKDERPDLRLQPDRPISELRVRDLQALIHSGNSKSVTSEVSIGFQLPDHIKSQIIKETKESVDYFLKTAKDSRDILKQAEKQIVSEKHLDVSVDPRRTEAGPDISKVVESLAALTKQVEKLSTEVEKLRGGGR